MEETTQHRSPSKWINRRILEMKDSENLQTDLISDGWHTFGELYDFRLAYNAMAFNLMTIQSEFSHERIIGGIISESVYIPKFNVHKSWKHHDGEWCFGEEKKWFIVAAKLPTGIITNHYEAEHWDLFKIPETEKSIFPFDGHTAHDALDRIFEFLKQK